MEMSIPESIQDLLLGKNFAHVATINPDGSPQVTPVWIDYDKAKNEILMNTAKGRKKTRNMFKGAKVAISIQDQNNPYRYLGIQGEIIDLTETGAKEHINKLSMKYMERAIYPLSEGEIRILIKIKPIYIHTMGN
ncbi:MAG: TIGR03618 family F420-dependent PPOX class oxidoreductase [Candidatus Heimdallarchaeota archaeon]|nr:TIGR03618 family F420-dependent PPOX class oxidoreductase [Candidatus Heimdallarchaeota archaeon]MCK4954084.1 TIGR03618 family F420-dependent PPOX class oxidoreductase [Candidatus Heimdallarchaeota archaeon]